MLAHVFSEIFVCRFNPSLCHCNYLGKGYKFNVYPTNFTRRMLPEQGMIQIPRNVGQCEFLFHRLFMSIIIQPLSTAQS